MFFNRKDAVKSNLYDRIIEKQLQIYFFFENEEKKLGIFKKFVLNNKYLFIIFLQKSNSKKIKLKNELNTIIKNELNVVINDLHSYQSELELIKKIAIDFFLFDNNDIDVYLDIYIAREIFLKLHEYYYNYNNRTKYLEVNYWLIRISYAVSDQLKGLEYYSNADYYLKSSDGSDLLEEEIYFIIRTVVNKTNILSLSDDGKRKLMTEFKNLLDIFERYDYLTSGELVNREFLNRIKSILFSNIADSGLSLARVGKLDDKNVELVLMFATNAKRFRNLMSNSDSISTADIALSEAMFYNGKYKTREEYTEILRDFINKLESDHKVSDNTKEELIVSIEELLLIECLSNNENSKKKKREFSKKSFERIFGYISSAKMSFDGMFFFNYVKIYVEMVKDFLDEFEIRDDIMDIIFTCDKRTYLHILEVEFISKPIIEEYIDVNPESFIGVFDFCNNVEDVYRNRKVIVDKILLAVSLHDTGKIAISQIVSKSITLTDYEFGTIKTHAKLGYDLNISFSKLSAVVALCHHKPYDLTLKGRDAGYPEFIPEELKKYLIVSQICSLADSISAATSDVLRDYSNPKTLPQIIDDIRMKSGTIYNPKIVTCFDNPKVVAKIQNIITRVRTDKIWKVLAKNEKINF